MIYPNKGKVAIVSQSGGILVDLLVKFASEGIGLSLAVSIGNKAIIKEKHLLKYLAADPSTSVIAFYIEGFGNGEGREFVEAIRTCPKPVIIMKAGRTPGGQRAVTSHTASLAGDYKVMSNIFAQFGIIEAKNELELLSYCESLSNYQRSSVRRIGIITGSGGHGAMAVDACNEHGLEVPMLTDSLQKTLHDSLSNCVQPIAALGNPVVLSGRILLLLHQFYPPHRKSIALSSCFFLIFQEFHLTPVPKLVSWPKKPVNLSSLMFLMKINTECLLKVLN